jgi:transcriptional regulator with XRE-family HTH domain
MPRTLASPRHQALVEFIIDQRKAAHLTQTQVAKRLKRYQSYVTNIETGQRRIDVVELMALAEAIGFDPASAIKHLYKIPKK